MRTLFGAFVVVFCASVAQADEYFMPQPPQQMQMGGSWGGQAYGQAYANTPLGIQQTPAWAAPWQQGSAYQPLPQYSNQMGSMGYGGYGGAPCPPQVLCSKTFVQTKILEKRTTITVTSRPGPSYVVNGGGVPVRPPPMMPGYSGGYQRPPTGGCCGGFGFVSRPIASVSVLGLGVQLNAPILVRR